MRSSKSSSTASTTSGLDAADAIVIELATILVHVVVYLAADEIVGAAASATVESMNSPAERGCRTASLTGDRTDGSAPSISPARSISFARAIPLLTSRADATYTRDLKEQWTDVCFYRW